MSKLVNEYVLLCIFFTAISFIAMQYRKACKSVTCSLFHKPFVCIEQDSIARCACVQSEFIFLPHSSISCHNLIKTLKCSADKQARAVGCLDLCVISFTPLRTL